METREKVLQCLKNVGVNTELETVDENDINLNEYIFDSIQFASFVVELEDDLSIELPYESLSSDSLNSLNGFSKMIDELT